MDWGTQYLPYDFNLEDNRRIRERLNYTKQRYITREASPTFVSQTRFIITSEARVLVRSLPYDVAGGETDAPLPNLLEILSDTLEILTNNIFDASALRQLGEAYSSNFEHSVSTQEMRDIIDSFLRATDIITIVYYTLRSNSGDADEPVINVFRNNGGLEKVQALYDGIPIEDIITV